MNDTKNYESRLWQLLEEEKLTDLSQFHHRGFFDEVPLFSRESQLRFLADTKQDINEILLTFALKFLKSVIAYESHRAGYFAAITARGPSADPILPCLFVWCGPCPELLEKLALSDVKSPFGKQIKKQVQTIRLDESIVVREELTIPEAPRAFIAPAQAPYQGFMSLDAFQSSMSPSH